MPLQNGDRQSAHDEQDGKKPGRGDASPSRSNLKQDRSIDTRDKLVKAAAELIRERGYAAFTTSAVAEFAGVSRGALQYHFASREHLFLAVRSRIANLMETDFSALDLLHLPIRERLSAIVDRYWEVLGAPQYVAAIEIRLYERFNQTLHSRLTQEMSRLTESRDRQWVRVFADSILTTDDLVSLRRFMLDALRGVALRKIEEGPESQVNRELDFLKQTLTQTLTQKRNHR